ncbi:hypothetical protein EJ08DRAFT_690636 [Tothia fuscella]|uniref:Yeast cell wall synthesis Kre9/Knh1-like N-terminal domain-containing protein n=1 Tax=Tothia fuscella TaxID=1048955 RepID=A0A9P4TT67_9PEZI|nr:hypothetical protein EJ08DRAFT_690636 [Tothia fuscella]
MFAKYFSVVAASAAVAFAYTTPTTMCTNACNPIAHPGLNEPVPAGTTYTVSWNPTTAGTVTILLLRGPAENLVVLSPIAEKIPNTGSFLWNVSPQLEADVSRYGIQLIDDATGTYQYSTQFGISGGAAGGASVSPSAPVAPSAPVNPSTSVSAHVYPSASASLPGAQIAIANTTTAAPSVYSSGSAYTNTSVIQPSSSMTVPTTLETTAAATSTVESASSTATSSKPATASTGAADNVKMSIAGAVFALFVAVAAL